MRFSGISILAMLLAITYCIGLIAAACDIPAEQAQQLQYPELSYEELIFDNSMVHIIDVAISEQDWEHLKKDAFSKECLESTVSIDGEKMYHVGVRTKGNSTLLLNSSKGWDRFSLALEFDAFQKSQRFHGLDQLSLYNNMFDPSFMKTYLCYEMMRSLDVASPLCSFAAVYVNGSFVGLYAASEVFSESFALRNFGYDYGNLYKPEQFDIAAIMRGELQNTKINLDAFSGDQAFAIENVFSVSNDAVRLAYLGETFYDYEDIWRNSTFPIGTSDKKRVVDALRRIYRFGEKIKWNQLCGKNSCRVSREETEALIAEAGRCSLQGAVC